MRSQLAKLFALFTVLLALAGAVVFAWQQYPQSAANNESPVTAALVLPNLAGNVRLSHPAHGTARCVDCHHPVGGKKLYRSCQDCHQAEGGRVPGAQAAMHQTCIGCHTRLMKSGKAAPSHRCSHCHETS